MIQRIKHYLAIRKGLRELKRGPTPNPGYARHRLSQLHGERKERFRRAVEHIL